MADFGWITPRLATGAAINSADDVKELLAAGITHIVDCRDDWDDLALLVTGSKEFRHKTRYLWNGTADDGQPKPPHWFEVSVEFAFHAFGQHHTKVYAHCAAGVNRGPSTAYAILRAFGLPPEMSRALVIAGRPQAGIAYAADADAAMRALGYE